MHTLTLFRSFPMPVRLLLVNHFAGGVGFYLLIPFLADYLLTDIGLSAAVVGVVLSVRNLSQQGLFLIGGTLADRLGERGVIVTGLVVRAVGFALFAVGESVPIVLAAAALTGFAGALFNPAVRAYLAHAAEPRSAEAFALFNIAANLGSALGPIAGVVLMTTGFRITAVVAAAIFAVLAAVQLALLPAREVPHDRATLGEDFTVLLRDRRFHAFALATATLLALQMQLYFLFTLQIQTLAGAAGTVAVAAMFITETIAFLLLQVRITRIAGRRRDRGPALATGLAVAATAFVIPPLAAPLVDGVDGDGVAATAVRIVPVLAATVVLAVGTMIAQPFINETIPRFGGRLRTGTYYGAFYLVAGLGTVALTALAGALVDRTGPLAWLPALLCAAAGAAAAAATVTLHRRGVLARPAEPAPATGAAPKEHRG